MKNGRDSSESVDGHEVIVEESVGSFDETDEAEEIVDGSVRSSLRSADEALSALLPKLRTDGDGPTSPKSSGDG
jgi:hypothetical protein